MTREHRPFRLLVLTSVVIVAACGDLGPIGPGDADFARGQDVAALFERASPEVLAVPGAVFADHDLATNQIVIGIEDHRAGDGIRHALLRSGVHADLYRVEVTEPIHFMSTLRSEIRPVVSGVQIHWSSFVCTLGFSVDHAGGRSFITNSHCTDNQGSTGNTQYNQPTRTVSPDPIGFEAHDPAYFRGSACPRGRVCRFSDAARALYEPGVESQARIAKTDGVNSGSLNIVGHFSITAQDNNNTSFSGTMHKVGRTTGWTSGSVSNTCATVNVAGSNITLLCQTLVSSNQQIVAGGDSGSPVFTTSSGDNVTLRGILWGGSGSGDLFVFSPFKQIQDELGSMNATTDGVGDGDGDNGGGDDGGGGNCPPNSNAPHCR